MDDLETETEMYKALALMHSTEESSGKNLRLMLDSLIKKKFGVQRTITSRISRTFLKEVETCPISNTLGEPQNISPGAIKSIKNYTTESDDSVEQDDVPRISIPDEGSEKSASCLEKGSNLGSFILLECQNCSEIYQPLCNQPPIDIDNFNPEFTWLCDNCSENSRQKRNLKTYSNKRRNCGKLTRTRMKIQGRMREMKDT